MGAHICSPRQSWRLVTFETLITILTIETLNSWQFLLPDNKELQWIAFAILAMFFFSPTKSTMNFPGGAGKAVWSKVERRHGRYKLLRMPGNLQSDQQKASLSQLWKHILQWLLKQTSKTWKPHCSLNICSKFYLLDVLSIYVNRSYLVNPFSLIC